MLGVHKTCKIFIYAKWGWVCAIFEHTRMTKCKCKIYNYRKIAPSNPTIPCVCWTEVRTINGFMLITIRNAHAWRNRNANNICLSKIAQRPQFSIHHSRCDFTQLFILKVSIFNWNAAVLVPVELNNKSLWIVW